MDDGGTPTFMGNLSRKWKKFFNSGILNNDDVTEEEIISMLKEGQEQGVLLDSEAEMIHNIFEFGDKEAKDIMTHRKNMVVLDGEMSFIDTISYIAESGKSRYPVYMNDADTIIGVLHIKDAFAYVQKNEIFRTSIKDIPGLLRTVEFIPETMNIHVLFKKMQTEKNHLVVVVDEYGQTSGIVAMEDILEEIVGNIEDEHDEEESLIREEAEGVYRIDGIAAFADVIDVLHIPMEEDTFETLNGFLISLLGKIPNDGETALIHAHGYEFQVLEVENKMIREVIVKSDSDMNCE